MKLSYNWLKEYIDIPYSPEILADKITMAGIEVEEIIDKGDVPNGVVVGEILERNPHPNADKLSICRVSDGNEVFDVICGAPNCISGLKTAFAKIGTVFIDGDKKFKIKKCKLRGQASYGMLCSEKELGLSDKADGIMEFPSEAETGVPLTDEIESDIVFEVETTPNRPDWLSHWGIARDIATLTGNELKFPEIPELKQSSSDFGNDTVELKAPELCPRYTARIIKNVKVAESPGWLKNHLSSIGLRPINNIVDITNFVLHELGHPLHAFDLAKLADSKIIVRNARKKEKMKTLDETELELDESVLVIADAEKPVALAGIMGGLHTGVENDAVDILLESAVFSPASIRTSSRDLNISSDSSFRFERGVDWNMAETASNRATSLILDIAGGELVSELIDVSGKKPDNPKFICRFDRIRSLTGLKISNDEIIKIFKSLGISVQKTDKQKTEITAPLYRLDLTREADLAEEVARIYGLDKVENIPVKAVLGGERNDDSYYKYQKINSSLLSLGLTECVNYSLLDKKNALLDSRFKENSLLKLKNPLSRDLEYMRPSLLAEMLNSVERNVSRQISDLQLFEFGRVFCTDEKLFPEERYECCIALTGRKHPERFSEELEEHYDFFDIKGIIEDFFDKNNISDCELCGISNDNFTPGEVAKYKKDGKTLAFFGKIKKEICSKMRLNNNLYVAVIELDAVLDSVRVENEHEEVSVFPSVSRDVAFVAEEKLSNQKVIDFIRKSGLKNLEDVRLFDIFRDKNIGENKKSLAYKLTFRHPEKTLTDKEINTAYEKLRKKLQSDLNVELR